MWLRRRGGGWLWFRRLDPHPARARARVALPAGGRDKKGYIAVKPPSMTSSLAVVKLAASEQR